MALWQGVRDGPRKERRRRRVQAPPPHFCGVASSHLRRECTLPSQSLVTQVGVVLETGCALKKGPEAFPAPAQTPSLNPGRPHAQGLVLFWPQNSDMEGKQGTGSVTRFVKELNNSGKALYSLS